MAYDPVDVHVGFRIRMGRKAQNISQGALADALGITFQQVQKYEKGANRVSASMLWKASEKLSEPISYFFDGLEAGDKERVTAAFEKNAVSAAMSIPALVHVSKLSSAQRAALSELISAMLPQAA